MLFPVWQNQNPQTVVVVDGPEEEKLNGIGPTFNVD